MRHAVKEINDALNRVVNTKDAADILHGMYLGELRAAAMSLNYIVNGVVSGAVKQKQEQS